MPTFLPRGDQPCRERGCEGQNAVQCAYVDRRNRRCPMTFCPIHWRIVGSDVLCRRHATTMAALGPEKANVNSHPDLDSRSASLVNWVGHDISDAMRDLLQRCMRPGDAVSYDHHVTVVHGNRRDPRRWQRGWRLVSGGHSGVSLVLAVDENDEATLLMLVDSKPVMSVVPPWIERRTAQRDVTPEQDQFERAKFYSTLYRAVLAELREKGYPA